MYETFFTSNSTSQTKVTGLKLMARSKTITSWQLFKTLWADRGWIVFICVFSFRLFTFVVPTNKHSLISSIRKSNQITAFVLETTRNLISFIPIAALHEIIQSFNQIPREGKSYAYLMCWAMFFGQTVEVLLSAYCW